MKRRSFFGALAALAASVLVPWRRAAVSSATGDGGSNYAGAKDRSGPVLARGLFPG